MDELKLTTAQLEKWLEQEPNEFGIEQFRRKYNIDADSNLLYVVFNRWVKDGVLRRLERGWYHKITPVEPVKWWNGEEPDPLNFKFPYSHDDGTGFGLDDCIEVFAGDLILISGRSNFGKTAFALNIMGENIDLFPKQPVLMGSEYTAADGKITPKFKRRLGKMTWVEWVKDGQPRFELLPVGADYEDYARADTLNLFDWISLPGEYYMIDRVMKAIKDRVGNGLGVAVLQKNKGAEFGEGGERTQRYADVELRLDAFGDNETLLTIGKVKASNGRASGRTWAFSIVDYGANLHRIREVVKCSTCWGKGYTGVANNYKRCNTCNGLKYIDRL